MTADHHHDHHHPHGAATTAPESGGDAGLAELLDLDGQVLHSFWSDAFGWVRQAADGIPHRRIVDLGAGTGNATIALAQRFAGAEVIAVDAADDMLSRVRAKALDLGLAERIRTVPVDLDTGWPALGPVDVTWAAMSLHHLADPDRVLGEVFAATRPGGLMAVAEMTRPLRFLPDELGLGRPGLEERCLDVLREEHAHSVPELGSDWATRLRAAGFTLVGEREMVVDLTAPQPAGASRYAHLWLQRLRSGLADRLAADDRGTLDVLLGSDGPQSLRQRTDLHIRGSRTITIAQRRRQ